MKYWDIAIEAYRGYWNYFIHEITNPSLYNYLYWLVLISLFTWGLEWIKPWRKKQSIIRKDFYKDLFLMFFNFFFFSLLIYNALSASTAALYQDFLKWLGIDTLILLDMTSWYKGIQLFSLFVLMDFLQWNIHRWLHSSKFLWRFHKLHHSVKEMGFAAHMRFHFMETILYKTILFIPMGFIGYGIDDFIIVHIFTILIGHLNHTNIGLDYGPFKYILNNPKMHIWHHAKELPKSFKSGVNFGITLSIWDYLFKTNYIPFSGKEIELGFNGDEKYPENLYQQFTEAFKS